MTEAVEKLRFASTWAVLAMNNLAAYERQTGRAVPDKQIVGYISAGKAEGMYILAGDVRLLADAARAVAPSADTFAGTVDTDTVLQAAAREAGWALEELINEIDFRKQSQVEGIITRLGLALEALPAAPAPEPVADSAIAINAALLDQARLFRETVRYYIRRDQLSGDSEGALMKNATLLLLEDVIAKAEQAMAGAEATP